MRTPRIMLAAVLTMALSAAAVLTGLLGHNARAEGAPPVAVQALEDPLDRQLAWALAQLNGDAEHLDEAAVTDHFAAALLQPFPADSLTAHVQGLATAGPFTFRGLTRPPTETQATALLAGSDGDPFVLEVSIEATPPHLITGLNVRPAPAPAGVLLDPQPAAGDHGERHGLVDIGGRRLYLSCRGSGGPTVVLESAEGDAAAPWFGVESAVAGFTRVCSYDRANVFAGASDPVPAPRTAADAVADLHALLGTAEVPGPYVLVGHTLGGLFAQLYASTHPAQVAGLVLVDSSHEEQDARLEALLPAEVWAELQERVAASPPLEPLDVPASYAQMRAARVAAPLRPMPLTVLADVRPPDPAEFPEGWPLAAIVQALFDLQRDLAARVPGGELISTEAGNYIHQTEPDLVVEAIRRVVEQARP